MREIRFRGYSVKELITESQWITDGYGVSSIKFVNGEEKIFLETEFGSYEVYKESIGQFTSLKDKRSKEICTRDVVIYTRHIYTDCSRMRIAEKQEPIVGEFCFFEGLWPGLELRDGSVMAFLPGTISSEEFEIIGTAFENPELLEGTE